MNAWKLAEKIHCLYDNKASWLTNEYSHSSLSMFSKIFKGNEHNRLGNFLLLCERKKVLFTFLASLKRNSEKFGFECICTCYECVQVIKSVSRPTVGHVNHAGQYNKKKLN